MIKKMYVDHKLIYYLPVFVETGLGDVDLDPLVGLGGFFHGVQHAVRVGMDQNALKKGN